MKSAKKIVTYVVVSIVVILLVLIVGISLFGAGMIKAAVEKTASNTGTETLPRLLREAAVENI